jgi:2-polyprenyl-3-methyl-5-hydroxy-6-metoxy-1,4-benzoquinol methylase
MSSHAPCPCCGSLALRRVQIMRDIDGRDLPIMECSGCSAYINVNDLSEALRNHALTEEQATGSAGFYLHKDNNQDAEIEACNGMLTDLLSLTSCGRSSMLDFGAGMGYLAAAATRHFDTVFAIEPSKDMLAANHHNLPGSNRIQIIESIDAAPALDAVVAWHVFEHLPSIVETLHQIAGKLSEHGSIYFQVPMLQQSHLVRCHYTFLNEQACMTICGIAGLSVNDILFDTSRNFLTCIASK